MSYIKKIDLEGGFDHEDIEKRCCELWERERVYEYDPDAEGELFSIDTPPPYVSASHLHVGHAMSYTQAEFVVRYQRMQGKKIFYPMGFDDNGLPTERFVEKKYKINKRKTTRTEFRELCLKETREGAKGYENLWRSLGLSVDWRTTYSTIDDHCRKTSQLSFLDLFARGRVYRSGEPVLWDTHFETALAQADVETIEQRGALHDIAFKSAEDGRDLVISTTRPELLPACVAMYCNSKDERYKDLIGKKAIVPLFGQEVPILSDDDVDPEYGTGLMMVCTFGDSEDVRRWKRDNLETRVCINPSGYMTELAGEFAGRKSVEVKKGIIKAIKAAGCYVGSKNTVRKVPVAERSGTPVEFMMVPQWFIKVMDLKEELLQRSAEINWNPEWMKARLDDWILGLKYDWNISRQRFYGVPFPLWFCGECNTPVVARAEDLPVDPLEDECHLDECPGCGSTDFRGEPDVMDTWMTSSLTPLVNLNWAENEGRIGSMDLYPMTVRVQAFEIIRTWLFYTVIKSHIHTDSLPWKDVMISGWGLNEQGKKISKRDLERFTDKDGFNRYEPYAVLQKYGADALRYWASGSQLGQDMRYHEKQVRTGRKLVVKIWNAARFCLMQMDQVDFDPTAPRPSFEERTVEDQWLLTKLNQVVPLATKGFEKYDYAIARKEVDHFFWTVFCDNYLEIVKDRFWTPERYPESTRLSACATMWEALRTLLGLLAPFIPFVTEELYQRIYQPLEGATSLHVTSWPTFDESLPADTPAMGTILKVLQGIRSQRTKRRIPQGHQLEALIMDISGAEEELQTFLKDSVLSLQGIARANEVRFAAAEGETDLEGVKLDIVVPPAKEETNEA